MTYQKSFFIAAIAGVFLATGAQAANLKLCHIANAGFLAASGDTAFIVDAVMARDTYNGQFALPSNTTLYNMHHSKEAFKNVKLALVTHLHGDHFDAESSRQHIENSPSVEYVLAPDAYRLLVETGLSEKQKQRVHSVMPTAGEGPVKMTIGSMSLEVYVVDHGPNMPQNLGYKITIGDKTVFHTGDINASAEQLAEAGLNKTPVDVMLMPFWYILEQNDTVLKTWGIKTMVPMHYHAKAQPWMADLGGPEGLRTAAQKPWTNSLRIDKEMQCEIIE